MRRNFLTHHSVRALAFGALGTGALIVAPIAPAGAMAPTGPTAYASALIGPNGGMVSGFGVTAKFREGAIQGTALAIITSWPGGLDVASPAGPFLKLGSTVEVLI